jgi:hypothetical protein
MRLSQKLGLAVLLIPAILTAESKNPADYPLRLHIFNRSQTTFYEHRSADEAKGEGRADLYSGGEAHGVDFTYDCSEKVKASFGYETYPAKWKKPNQELVVLLPVFGKAGAYYTCNFKTDVKDFAYATQNGKLREEPVAAFKTWMTKHEYDPEHGKNVPVKPEPPAGATTAPPAAEPKP